MAPVKLKEVIVYSSQDPVHRVDNLLQQSSQWKRWLCAPGDRSGSMQAEFQLEKAAKIGYIDIGNYGSAFVEVLVRKSSWASNKYVTLIPATMLMSPMECRSGQNKCAVKMFTKTALNEESLKDEWDRIKVKCSQPYKKDAQFGLAFIRLRSLEEQKDHNQTVSPGPTMTKLNSKSESTPTTNKPRGCPVLSPSWKTNSSFQRQVLSISNGGNKKSDEQLKMRLLKMAATADSGSDKSDSLSRSAKMVLASTNNVQLTPKSPPGNHGNNAHSPVMVNNSRSKADKSPANGSTKQDGGPTGQRRQDSGNENMSSTPSRMHHGNCYHANKPSDVQTPPKPILYQNKSGRNGLESHTGTDQGQRGPEKALVSKQATKRPSSLPADSSPVKMKSASSQKPFKQVAEDFLTSLGHYLLDSKLSDIRPALERQLGRKLNKEEKKILKELAVERVDFLIKNGSSPAVPAARPSQSHQPKPQSPASCKSSPAAPASRPSQSQQPNHQSPASCKSSPAVPAARPSQGQQPKPQSQSSSSTKIGPSVAEDSVGMEFRNCPKCYLKFTARQMTGHILVCEGIKSASGITMATNASSAKDANSASAPRRGGGRGRGRGRGGGRGGKKSLAGNETVSPPASHIRTAPMPSYRHEGAIAKQKSDSRTGNSLPGGFLIETFDPTPQNGITTSEQEGMTARQEHDLDSPNITPALPRINISDTKTSPISQRGNCVRSACSPVQDQSDACSDSEEVVHVPCPVCFESYPMEIIERHADLCLERRLILAELSSEQMVCL